MGGKGSIRIPAEILRSLGIKVFILADTDFLGASRNHPVDSTKQANAHNSHKIELAQLQAWLNPTAPVVFGASPFQFGDATIVTAEWALLHDDLETELDQWSEFMTELHSLGGALRDKNVALYRSAVADAELNGLPSSLAALVDAVTSGASRIQ